MAPKHFFSFGLLVCTLLGMSLVIACGCVLNNIVDKDIDKLMVRTQKRVLAQGQMAIKWALVYAIVLGVCGFSVLYFFTNMLTTAAALLGLVVYAGIYTLWFKRNSLLSTLVGGIAGAVPPVVGYCAVTNHFDMGALIVFLLLFFWQIPHFYAIAIYRLQDFESANIPVLPRIKGMRYTKINMLVNLSIFVVISLLPTVLGYVGIVYLLVAIVLNSLWLMLAIQGLKTDDNRLWARKMFALSVLTITLLSLFMAVPY